MKPGIYDISNEEYHSGPGISRSGIELFRRSPLHYWDRYLNENRKPDSKNESRTIGNALHTLILESDKFNDLYIQSINTDRRTKEGKLQWDEFCKQANGKEILTAGQYQMIFDMRDSLEKAEIINKLLSGKVLFEKSIYWIDDETGILCKARPDIWRNGMICDLKTTRDASENVFKRECIKYGYHIQAAMIKDGIYKTTGAEVKDFIYIAIEKTDPYVPAVYLLDELSIQRGYQIYKETLHKYKKCMEENNWPGYEIKEISLAA